MSTAHGQRVNEDMKITASDSLPGDHFGYAVAIDQEVIAIGAPQDDDKGIDSGSAYLFETSTGSQLTKLLPDDGSAGDGFGFSVAVGENFVAETADSWLVLLKDLFFLHQMRPAQDLVNIKRNDV